MDTGGGDEGGNGEGESDDGDGGDGVSDCVARSLHDPRWCARSKRQLNLVRGHGCSGEVRRKNFGDARGGCRRRLVHGVASDYSVGRRRIRGREGEEHSIRSARRDFLGGNENLNNDQVIR